MEPFIAIGLLVAFSLLAIMGHQLAERQRAEAWSEIAKRLGLNYANHQIHGTLRDVVVRVWTETRGSGKSQSVWTFYRASISGEVPLGLKLSREGLYVKIGKVTNSVTDIQLDLRGIDEELQVRAADPDEVRRWARRADVSRALQDLVELRHPFIVEPQSILVEQPGVENDADAIESVIEKLVDIARALSGKGYGALIDDGKW